MIWPWVSREAYDDIRASRDFERALVNGFIERIQSMTQQLVDLNRPAPPATVFADQTEPIVILPDPVRDVIREQAEQDGRLDHQLASHFRKLARQMKRDGKTDDEIIGALVQWQTSEAID
jgi:hypothetical protein